MKKNTWQGYRPILEMRVYEVKMIFGLVSKLFGKQFARGYA